VLPSKSIHLFLLYIHLYSPQGRKNNDTVNKQRRKTTKITNSSLYVAAVHTKQTLNTVKL